MRESVIESYLVEQVHKVRGEAYKFSSPNRRGVPDRLCVFRPNPRIGFKGSVAFVEVKATKGALTQVQRREHARLARLGHLVFVARSKEDVDSLIGKHTQW